MEYFHEKIDSDFDSDFENAAVLSFSVVSRRLVHRATVRLHRLVSFLSHLESASIHTLRVPR